MIFLAGANELSEEIVGQFGWAALFSLVGMVIVIIVLAVLVVILTMLSKFINLPIFEKRKSSEKHLTAESIAHLPPHGAEREEIVAAITAALSVIYASQCAAMVTAKEDEAPPPPFIIKSIRKI